MPSKCSSETLTSENLPVGVLRCSALPVTDERPCASFSQPSTHAQASHSLLLTPRFSFCTCPVSPSRQLLSSSPAALPSACKHALLSSDHMSRPNYCPISLLPLQQNPSRELSILAVPIFLPPIVTKPNPVRPLYLSGLCAMS